MQERRELWIILTLSACCYSRVASVDLVWGVKRVVKGLHWLLLLLLETLKRVGLLLWVLLLLYLAVEVMGHLVAHCILRHLVRLPCWYLVPLLFVAHFALITN